MSDRTLTCRDCGQEFVFTAGEQAFYQERGFSEPKRCPTCRSARKSQRANDMGSDYAGGGYSSSSYGNGGYGGNSYGGHSAGYNSGPRQLYPAVCSQCGRPTEVPFQPRSDKPVYCRECYQERRASSPRYSSY